MRCFVMMGVSGCGKTSVGTAVAARCGLRFVDGDDLHPAANIAKMSRGEPLTDADRAPWLAQVGQALAAQEGRVVIGCSALKRSYRDIIRQAVGEPVFFVHLHAGRDVLLTRVNARDGHFMPPSLLDSQFEALEHLEADEQGGRVDIALSFDQVVEAASGWVARDAGG